MLQIRYILPSSLCIFLVGIQTMFEMRIQIELFSLRRRSCFCCWYFPVFNLDEVNGADRQNLKRFESFSFGSL